MRILHIGDFHFKSKDRNFDQETIVSKFLKHVASKEKIDLVFFSGDLVFSGSNSADFEKAHGILFEPMCDTLGIDPSNIILSPGNHDVNRNECSEALAFFFNSRENMGSNEKVDKLYLNKSKDYQNSIISINEYYQYSKKHLYNTDDVHEPLYSIHQRSLEGKEIGIITINSAWLSTGFLDDKNNLLFPPGIIKEALKKIKGADIKILIKHHPLHYFKEFNFIELQNIIHQEFDLMFSGHLHKEENSTVYSGTNGIYCNVTQASLTYDKGAEIGYSVVNVDFSNLENLVIDKGTFLSKKNDFIDLESIGVTLPCGIEKQKQNRFRQKIVEKYNYELEVSNQLLLSYDPDELDQNFLDTFTPPKLSKNSEAEQTSSDEALNVNYDNLIKKNDNFLIFGEDKCGKTSLLKRLQLYYLKNYSFNGIIPFYFDYKEWENYDNKVDLIRIIANYFQINKNDTIETIKSGKLILLIDNLNIKSPLHDIIVEFLVKFEPRFIVCSEYVASRVYSTSVIDDLDFEKLFFRDLSRKEIRIYTEKIYSVKAEKTDEVVEKITNFCTQLKLPLNFWTVSIILVIFKKSNDDYTKSLFAVLDSCVDEMLQKKKLAFEKGGLEFDQYKEVCSQLAFHLLKKHRKTVYSATAIEIITFIDDYKKKNRRIVGDAKDIFDFLLESGILKRKGDLYTFRLNGVFEYFLAYFINDDKSYIDEILNDDSIYLSFKNELEIYSGLNRKNEELLNKVFHKTKDKLNPVIKLYENFGRIDDILDVKLTKAQGFSKTIKKLVVNNPLTGAEKDDLQDALSPMEIESDVKLKEYINTDEINFELLEKYIGILSRVFKSSDRILNQELVNEIFDYIIEAYCYLGYYLIDEFEEFAKAENLKLTADEIQDKVIGENILKLVSNFIPLLAQAMLYDGVGHINLKDIIQQKIDELVKTKDKNQFKLYLLYFLQMDIDISQKNLIDDVFRNIHKNALRVSTLLKLNYYLAFKAYKNKTLEKFFREKIKQAQLGLDSKTDISEFQRVLSRKEKSGIVKKQSEK